MINRGGATRTRESLFAGPAPQLDGDRLTWRAPAIGIDVVMTRRAPAWTASLIDGVTWRCEFPSAGAAIAIDGEPEIRGNGYAELLQLDVAPWELPIDELLWGHSDSMTWIEWRGAHPLRHARRVAEDPGPAAAETARRRARGEADRSLRGRLGRLRDSEVRATLVPSEVEGPMTSPAWSCDGQRICRMHRGAVADASTPLGINSGFK
jgi:hypothetical protein